MASALERRMDLARASLAARAGQASEQQQTAMQERFASTGGLQSGAAIKAGQAAERALSRQQLAGESDISRGEAQAEAERERAAMQRKFAQEQAAESRQFASSEAVAGRELAASESALDRALAQRGINIAKGELAINEQVSLDNLSRSKAEAEKEKIDIGKEIITGGISKIWAERLLGRKISENEELILSPEKQFKRLTGYKAPKKAKDIKGKDVLEAVTRPLTTGGVSQKKAKEKLKSVFGG